MYHLTHMTVNQFLPLAHPSFVHVGVQEEEFGLSGSAAPWSIIQLMNPAGFRFLNGK